jgi:tape measure domain-containing protein
MAQERLIFPIGFDLESGVADVRKQWNAVHKKLQTEISSKPLKLKVQLDTKGVGLNDLKEYIKLSKDAEQATKNATTAAKRAADIRSKNAMARQRESKARVAEATETTRIAKAKTDAAMAELKLQHARTNGLQSINAQTRAYGTQTTYLNRLIKRFAVYMSVYQVINFVKNIQSITAEFELQRVALGSIIGSAERAQSLFNTIKEAAIKSPFEIKDLVTYTKQLAAYKIETDELFDTTMRLADISAGLGVSMDRITLAYGQIRAAGYLRASEVRQLTEAGIPIVEELAKKMSELRGETYSAADVMGLISERAISFGMVKDVFDDMTSAGGMFYKMQEKQAETLKGQWNNMKDAISIMFDEIGRTPEVMQFMKDLASGVKTLAKNWRNVWEVMKTLGLAYASYITYTKVSMLLTKAYLAYTNRFNTAIALEAQLTARLAVLQQKNGVLTKLQIRQTKSLIAANTNLAMSTNVATAAWNRLKIALLSNPFGIILAAIGAVIGALMLYKDVTEDFTDNSLDSLDVYRAIENSKDKIKEYKIKSDLQPMVEELDALREKTSLTADEQERYNDLLSKLLVSAPELFQQIGGQQAKLSEGLTAVNNEMRKLLEKDLKTYRGLLKEYQNEIINLEVDVESGIKESKYKIDGFWGDVGRFVLWADFTESTEWLLDKTGNLAKNLKKIQRIKYTSAELIEKGEKIMKLREESEAVNKIIEQLEIALGIRLPKALEGWRKKVASFEKDGTTLYFKGDIENYSNLYDLLEDAAKRYEEAKKKTDQLKSSLASVKLKPKTEDQQAELAEIEKELKRVEITKDLAYELLEYFGALDLLNKNRNKDTRLADLKDQINDLTNAYKKFIELRKYKFEPEALDDIDILFPSLKGFKPTYDNMVSKLEQMLADVKVKLAKSPKDSVLIDMERELEKALANVKFDKLKTDLEEKLSRLSDQVSKTKAAKEFYDKILGMTGDRELSATFTMSVYGETGEDLAKNTVKQIEAAFEGVDLSGVINYNNFQVDWQKLAKLYEENQDKLLEKNRDTAKKLIENAQQVSAKQMEQWAKDLEKVKTFADKRIELAQKTAEKIRQIEMSSLPKEEQDSLIEQYRQREAKEATKLEYEAFKDSPAYVEMFSELDSVSTKMLNHLREKINDLQSEWQNLDPTQLKELQSRLEKIDEQLAKRNPFKALTKSMSDYFEIRKKGSRRDAEKSLSDALIKQADAHKVLEERIKAVNDAQKKYDDAKAGGGETSTLTILAKNQLNNAQQQLQTQQRITEETDESVESAQQLVSAWDRIKKGSKDALGGINDITQALTQATSQIYEAFGSFGGDDADKELFGTIVDGIGKTTQGFTDLTKGIMSGNPVDIINGITNAVVGIANLATSGIIYRANKEIATQQERIDSLSYAYGRLEKAMESALGTEVVQNYQERINALMAQETAYLNQAEAERSKGKKADQDKIKEYEDAARDAADNVKDMYSELQEYFLGTNLTSAARDFAQSWIEAYKQFGSTTDAMKEKFADMIQNMIIESLAAKVMEQALEPVFTAIDEYTKDGTGISVDEAVEVARLTKEAAENSNVGMTNLMNALKQAGLDVRDTTSGLTGISKDIASASEESILGLAAGVNTQNFYISQIHADVAMIAQWVQMGGMATQGVNVSDLITMQNQHLSYLPNIAANTAATLMECKNILLETTRIADTLSSVVKPQGVKASYRLNTSL